MLVFDFDDVPVSVLTRNSHKKLICTMGEKPFSEQELRTSAAMYLFSILNPNGLYWTFQIMPMGIAEAT